MSVGSAINRWKGGDRLGSLMDVGLGAASFIQYVGGAVNMAGSGLMGLRDSYRNNNPQPSQLPPQSEPRLAPKVSALTLYKQAYSNFRRDLENPSAGMGSDLHQAIAPMVSPNIDRKSTRLNSSHRT